MPRLFVSLLLLLGIASSASAVAVDWVPIGDPENGCDQQRFECFGSVGYSYRISKYEVTNAQYAEFLNAVAASDAYYLYNPNMGNLAAPPEQWGGITRSGSLGAYAYAAITGRENLPVNYVSFSDAIQFVNWLHNGQPTGGPESTYTGAYSFGIAGDWNSMTRNPGARFFLPTDNEWFKAAYYDASSSIYLDYPIGSNTQTNCAAPGAPNAANCGNAIGHLTEVGSYSGSESPYGVLDLGGNVGEWTERFRPFDPLRGVRGGSFFQPAQAFAADACCLYNNMGNEMSDVGIRLVSPIPEPSTGLLLITGLFGLAGWRRGRA